MDKKILECGVSMSPINWSEICVLGEYDENMTESVAHFSDVHKTEYRLSTIASDAVRSEVCEDSLPEVRNNELSISPWKARPRNDGRCDNA